MKRVKLVIAYDGTYYHGWQMQPNGITVEEVLNRTLSDFLKEPIAVIGASRTDSGVHAMGNVAVFDTASQMPADKICFALNQRLPEDIRIQSSEEIALDWHPRRTNCIKTYEYRILNKKIDMPLYRLYTHFCYMPLDVEQMQTAASYFVGEHDFKSFSTARVKEETEETVRIIYSLEVSKSEDDIIAIHISGSGFLYNMVRIIAGTLLKVGMGAYPPEHVLDIMDAKDRTASGPKMPAKGLTLMSLIYETHPAAFIFGKNRLWSYCLLQMQVMQTGCSYLFLKYCIDTEVTNVLRRVIHQAVRNGARTVYVIDLEKNRLSDGDIYGYYTLESLTDNSKVWEQIKEDLKEEILTLPVSEYFETDRATNWYIVPETLKNLEFMRENRKKEVDTHG